MSQCVPSCTLDVLSLCPKIGQESIGTVQDDVIILDDGANQWKLVLDDGQLGWITVVLSTAVYIKAFTPALVAAGATAAALVDARGRTAALATPGGSGAAMQP